LKRTLLWLLITAVLVVAFLLYRSSLRNRLNVTPDAAREIEKAKRR
jgi:type VI protein secretion system component VasF